MKNTGPKLPTRFQLLGLALDRLTIAEAVDRIAHLVEIGGCRQVVTINPEFTMAARRDRHFRRVLREADLAVADGIGIVWASRLLGDRLPERVGGIDLVERLAERAAHEGKSLFLLGAGPGVAEAAAAALRSRYPTLIVVGVLAESPRPCDEARIRAAIRAAHPDILLVAFGAPTQDLWIARNQAALGVPVAMGVGGAFDFLAGRIPRAPVWMRRLGIEWFYRLMRQPWRWRRMIALPRFAAMVLVLSVTRWGK